MEWEPIEPTPHRLWLVVLLAGLTGCALVGVLVLALAFLSIGS